MNPNDSIKVTVKLSTKAKDLTKPTVWDFAAFLKAQGKDIKSDVHTEEIIGYRPDLTDGAYISEHAQATMDQKHFGLGPCENFLLTIDAVSLVAALEIRNQILNNGLRPIAHPKTADSVYA